MKRFLVLVIIFGLFVGYSFGLKSYATLEKQPSDGVSESVSNLTATKAPCTLNHSDCKVTCSRSPSNYCCYGTFAGGTYCGCTESEEDCTSKT